MNESRNTADYCGLNRKNYVGINEQTLNTERAAHRVDAINTADEGLSGNDGGA